MFSLFHNKNNKYNISLTVEEMETLLDVFSLSMIIAQDSGSSGDHKNRIFNLYGKMASLASGEINTNEINHISESKINFLKEEYLRPYVMNKISEVAEEGFEASDDEHEVYAEAEIVANAQVIEEENILQDEESKSENNFRI